MNLCHALSYLMVSVTQAKKVEQAGVGGAGLVSVISHGFLGV